MFHCREILKITREVMFINSLAIVINIAVIITN